MQPVAATSANSAIPAGARRRPSLDDIAGMLDDAADQQRHAAGTMFVDPERRVLLLKRAPGEANYPGHWSLPGGKAEAGESPEDAAEREASEETGGTAPKGRRTLIRQVRTPTGMVFHTFLQPVAEPFEPRLADGEHTEHTWAPLDKLPEPMHPAVAATMQEQGGLIGDAFLESDHPRASNGQFGSGGGGASPGKHAEKSMRAMGFKTAGGKTVGEKLQHHGETIKRGGKATVDYLKSGAAKESLKQFATSHRVHHAAMELLSFGLQSLVSHGTGVLVHKLNIPVPDMQGLDPSTWKLNEEGIDHLVKDFSTIAKVSTHQGRDLMKRAIDGLIKTRKPAPDAAHDAEDEVLAVLEALRDLLDDGETDVGATDHALSLALDRDSVREKDRDGRMIVSRANISKATVNPYKGSEIPDWERLGLDPDRIYNLLRHPDELAKAAHTFNGIPVLRQHVPVSAEDHQPYEVVGTTGTDANFADLFLTNSLRIWAQDAIDDIESGEKKELSCGYHYRPEMTPGEFEGAKYDGVMRDICGNHVALVKDGRAGPDVVVGDSNEEIAAMSDNRALAAKMNAVVIRTGTVSALTHFLRPRLAQDAKINFGKVFDGVTGAKFNASIPQIAQRIKDQAKGKLAKDASLEQVEQVLKMLGEHEVDGGDESVSEAQHGAMEAAAHGNSELDIPKKVGEEFAKADKGKTFDEGGFRNFLKEKGMGEDDINSAMGMLPKPAVDEDPEEKKRREEEEAKKAAAAKDAEMDKDKDKVTKGAMDAAISAATEAATKAARATERAIRVAERDVQPYVGELKMSFDSAEEVYRHALGLLGVEQAKDIHSSALKTILEMQPKAGARQAERTTLSMDAASVQKTTDKFGLGRIGTA